MKAIINPSKWHSDRENKTWIYTKDILKCAESSDKGQCDDDDNFKGKTLPYPVKYYKNPSEVQLIKLEEGHKVKGIKCPKVGQTRKRYKLKCGVNFDSMEMDTDINTGKKYWTIKDKLDCCFGTVTNGLYGKNPILCKNYTETECNTFLQEYCNESNNHEICYNQYSNLDKDAWKNFMSERCTNKNLNESICLKFCEEYPKSCHEAIKKYCINSNLKEKSCKNFCNRNLGVCRDNLKNFCKNQDPLSNNYSPSNNNICACFYPDNFYDNYHKNIVKQLNLPEGDGKVSSVPECLYPKCQRAEIKNNDPGCPPVNIANCFNNVDINNEGKISGDINIKGDCIAEFCTHNGCYDRQEITTTLPPNDNESTTINDSINGGSDGGANGSSATNGGSGGGANGSSATNGGSGGGANGSSATNGGSGGGANGSSATNGGSDDNDDDNDDKLSGGYIVLIIIGAMFVASICFFSCMKIFSYKKNTDNYTVQVHDDK